MPRGPRITFDNALFHIVNRGNARQEIFHEPADFDKFAYILACYKDKFGFKMYHCCLMPNHIHFLWEIPKAEILSKAMQGITLSYTRFHHAKYKQVGHFWQGRFKNVLVEKESHAMHIGGYIEKNPVRAGLVKKPDDWKWSSFRFYAMGEPWGAWIVGEDSKKKWVDLIDSDSFYEELGDNPIERQKNYLNFIGRIDDDAMKKELSFQNRVAIGSENFRKNTIERLNKLGIVTNPKTKKRGRPRKGE